MFRYRTRVHKHRSQFKLMNKLVNQYVQKIWSKGWWHYPLIGARFRLIELGFSPSPHPNQVHSPQWPFGLLEDLQRWVCSYILDHNFKLSWEEWDWGSIQRHPPPLHIGLRWDVVDSSATIVRLLFCALGSLVKGIAFWSFIINTAIA
jgi:hypothetical protein